MIYDRVAVTLLTALAAEERDSTNAILARYLIEHAMELPDISVKGLAKACNVGTGSVSRFVRDVGFANFDDLRASLAASRREFGGADDSYAQNTQAERQAELVCAGIQRVSKTIDRKALARLAADIAAFDNISAYGPLKAQGAAVSLQVDLLMLGKAVNTATGYAEQLARIARASKDELIIIFSYTGSYFEECDLSDELTRIDRPKIWVVSGARTALPSFVADRITFEAAGQEGHPFQLEFAARLISQEYAGL